MKKQNGITLIALVITIIVMLILVGVSVTVALNGGLFRTAKDAANETKIKRDEELKLSEGKVQINGEWYDSMAEYVGVTGNGGPGGSGGETPDGEQVRFVLYDDLGGVIYDEYVSVGTTIEEWYNSLNNEDSLKSKFQFGTIGHLLYLDDHYEYGYTYVGYQLDDGILFTVMRDYIFTADTEFYALPDSVILGRE